jgi:crotonobetainyl-CoA:carnitine CoA-transferase CaiB-like acyl-CoA transferase
MKDLIVLEVADGIAGPVCGLQMADLGARVIKVEDPAGDRTRGWGPPFVGDEGAIFLGLNRSKESVVLDPADAGYAGHLEKLIRQADVLIEHPRADRPSVSKSIGKDPVSVNPRLIHLSITANGTRGDLSSTEGSELTAQAMSGYWRLLGSVDQPPLRHGAEIAEMATAMFAYQAVVAALLNRARGGSGQLVELSLLGSLSTLGTILYAATLNPDEWSGFHLLNIMWAPDTGFRTADGKVTLEFRRSRAAWEEFCRQFGLEHLAQDPRFKDHRATIYTGDRVAHTKAEYEEHLTKYPTDMVVKAVVGLGGVSVPHNRMSAVVSHPQVETVGIIGSSPLRGGGRIRSLKVPFRVKMAGGLPEPRPAPLLGEHTTSVLSEATLKRFEAPVSGAPGGPAIHVRDGRPGRGPLAGLKVLDIGAAAVGPWGAMLLGQMGADVIKLENPVGDSLHHVRPKQNGYSTTYAVTNLNKRGIILDLKQDMDRAAALEIAASADVVVQNFRTGVAERLGIGYDAVSKRNPRVIYLSVCGFGQTGPMKDVGCSDQHCQAFCGYGALNGPAGSSGELMRYYAHHDLTSAMVVTQAILTALLEREKTGQGQMVETSMLEAGIALQRVRLSEFFATGMQPGPMGSAISYCVPDQAFRCGDNTHLAITAGSEAEWRRLCEAVGLSELAEDPRFAKGADRVRNRDQLVPVLEAHFLTQPALHWQLLLTRARVPVSYFLDHQHRINNSHFVANGFFERIRKDPWGEVAVGGMPWRFHGTPAEIRPPCFPGEHTKEVLDEYGVQATKREPWRYTPRAN